MTSIPTTPGPVFGPEIAGAAVAHPLGKAIRLRIDLEGCRGLPVYDDSDTRASYQVDFEAAPDHHKRNKISSLWAQEGGRLPPGMVQWDEILYFDCYEHSILKVELYSTDGYLGESCRPVTELLTRSKLQICDSPETEYTLFLSASKLCASDVDDDVHACDYTKTGSNKGFQHSKGHVGPGVTHRAAADRNLNPRHTMFYRLSLLTEAVYQLNTPFDVTTISSDAYYIQSYSHSVYQDSLSMQPYHPEFDALMMTMDSTVNAILPMASTYLQRRTKYVPGIMANLLRLATIMDDLVRSEQSGDASENPEVELARLTLLIVTPDPTCGSNSTSAISNRHTVSGTIAKDALLFALEAIVQSSDAFGPLKSAASGLLFFATSAEMASSNKKQVRDIYKRVDGLAASLRRGTANGSPLTLEHQEAITSLAEDVAALTEELYDIIEERKSRFKRFFAAKRHRDELQGIVTQLDNTRMNYMMAMATLNATTNANVLAHVQAYSVVLGTGPTYAPGTRRADAITFPFSNSRVEEV